MLDFRSFVYVHFLKVRSPGHFLSVASRADVVSPVPRYVEFKKQQLEGKNLKDLNSH